MKKYSLLALMIIALTIFLSVVGDAQALPPPQPTQGTTVRSKTTMPAPGNLAWKNGAVVKNHAVYTIFWLPTGYSYSPKYISLINGFMQNVAADSGKQTNIYSSLTQYSDSTGNIPYQINFGGTLVDNTPFPNSGCTPSAGMTNCLTDDQLRLKIQNITGATQGWSPGMDKLFFIFLPKNVTTCFDSTGTHCQYTDYCAYHHHQTINNTEMLYAVVPYAMGNKNECGSFSHPNGDDADSSINTLAHEHNELITDPMHNAWQDSDSRERADRCAWQFGQPLGWTVYGKYNQVINGQKYYVQGQWSNRISSCVLSGA